MEFIEGLSSNLTMTEFTTNQIQLNQYLLECVEWLDVRLSNFTITNVTTAKDHMINIAKTHVELMQGITVNEVEAISMQILSSTITEIDMCNLTSGIYVKESSIGIFKNSKISSSGSTSTLYGGALNIQNSNSTMRNMTFENNIAQTGGAIHISCDTYDICQNIISDSTFSNNFAVQQGGAISYDFRRPDISNLEFINNQAAYGPNIASYPVRIVNSVRMDEQIVLTNVTSGMTYHETITMLLVDYDSQTMNLINISQVNIVPVTSGATLQGVDYSVLVNGQADSDNLQFVYGPGQDNIEYVATCDLIDQNKVSYLTLPTNNSIDVSFRYCMPGEQVINNSTCSTWSAGTYSFIWNSTECKSCMDNAVWLGGAEVFVSDEHWRLNGNSTDILFWPRPQSCKGGYKPQLEHPVEWETGYKGHLWARWDIIDGKKYQRISTYQWSKCPNAILNGFLVWLVMILAFAYLLILIITTIRKKKENQTSILLRIMTNYLQLIAAAYSFNLRFPESFIEIFGSVEILGSSSDAFLSFDWFVEDTEIKFFTPSTEIFKVFLTIFLPIALILIFVFIWVLLYLISSKKFGDLRRNVIISIICTMFLLHPNITKQALSLFECIDVGNNDLRVRMHMDFKWYSSDHMKWIGIVGMPCLIIWVITVPVVAFIILFKNRDHLDDEKIKRYYLILYQGLTKKVFYWEFINTIRKVLLIALNSILSILSVIYRILICIILLITVERLQQKLKPYSQKDNNEIEIKAIIAGTIVLFWGLIFEEGAKYNYPRFNTMAFGVIIVYNTHFIMNWTYLFLDSLNFKNENLRTFLKIYSYLVCKHKVRQEKKSDDQDIKKEEK